MIHVFNGAGQKSGRLPGDLTHRLAVLFLCLLWAATLGGCAGSTQKTAGSGHRSADDLALAVANANPGYVNVAASPYGRGLADVGEPYMSALGLPCRPVVFLTENEDRYDLAVCAEKNGVWSTAPNIFASNHLR